MKIIGIDPGYDRLGIAVVEKPEKGKEAVLFSECFSTSSEKPIYERLLAIGNEAAGILDKFKPNAVALETLFITKNQKTAMRVAEARGIIIYEAVKRSVPLFEYSPMEIKMAVTGDGTSDKARMIKMVHLLVPITKKKHDDEYDAIAVALTHAART
ncbi:crossover junction endodeoxyribonuclease RuvC [Patescibacteria group bacterium]|nr:crossover junction endodeoxyribonuclease RuvC [Patescibacteria group bacterium]MDE1946634.1 crossover junction endodeoxyribonuclease RuvC [Patescibacteria group bacterium]MDE2010588.1 crossover junction endodeoxyribonuclease RuvC [Patescibacteria group bacterium]MDE2233694.1 crossover junction endodeoxyribonuclease RuvC [Patescibacteria group bacterium]